MTLLLILCACSADLIGVAQEFTVGLDDADENDNCTASGGERCRAYSSNSCMTSLMGKERDRDVLPLPLLAPQCAPNTNRRRGCRQNVGEADAIVEEAVSYTHLTLPTIYSV